MLYVQFESVGDFILSCQEGSQGTVWQVHRVRSLVLRFDLCALPCFLRLFPGPFQAGVPGRLVPVGSDYASQRRDVSKGPVHLRSETRVGVESGVWPGLSVRDAGQSRKRAPFLLGQACWLERQARVGSERCSSLARPSSQRGGSESEVVLWLGLPVGEAVRRWAGDRSERSGQRGGPESEAGAIPPRPGLPVRDWISPLVYLLGTWAGPLVACCLLRLSLCWKADPRGTLGL